MNNSIIAEQFSLLAKLIDLHGEDSFKAKSYASAAFTIEKLTTELSGLDHEKLFQIRGIGQSTGKKVVELLESGELKILQEYLSKTPEGVLEMMNIKGLGPKKIHVLWKEMKIDHIDQLAVACEENRIAAKKGFGQKTQEKILSSIRFQKENSGKYLFARVEGFADAFTAKLKKKFPQENFAFTGAYSRQMEIIESIDWVTTTSGEQLKTYLVNDLIKLVADRDGMLVFSAEGAILFRFYLSTKKTFFSTLFLTSSSEEFLQEWKIRYPTPPKDPVSEEKIFDEAELPFIPPFLRESKKVLDTLNTWDAGQLIQTKHIKGLIHAHSNWSDGGQSIEEMAKELIQLGFEYLVLSDHSKAAFYANGMSEERIREQHKNIDELNKKLSPFRIFKSIECDILSDGTLDYSNDVLSTFDLVITSIHSNLDMEAEKAMQRLLGAITNPYTTILGHMTGRLLLRRNGYPVDHQMIIDACAAHRVVIEINANPNRLDMDWRWISYALERGVLLSIDPDAHTLEEFHNIKYGVLVAQKGGLTPGSNLSSFTLKEFEKFLDDKRIMRGK